MAKVAAPELPPLMQAVKDGKDHPANLKNRFIACWQVRDAQSMESSHHCRNLSWYSNWNASDTTTLQLHCRAQSVEDCPLLAK
jgi:hypothetical protein